MAKPLYQWQKTTQQPLPADPREAAEVRALRAQVRRQAQELEILKKPSPSSRSPNLVSQLQFIDHHRVHYPVQLLCHVLRVVPSRHYAWCQRAVPKAEPAWETALVDVFDEHQRRYGTRRLQVELRELGHRVGRQALRTALHLHGRKILQTNVFMPRTTDSTHGKRCAPNLLLDQPKPTQANRVWVSDSTTCPWPTGTGPTSAPFRIWLASR